MASQSVDPEFKLVSSYLISPALLAAIRLLFAFFTFVTLLFLLIWEGVVTHQADSYFSYFTNLTFIGLSAYFIASGIQTFLHSKNLRKDVHAYPLQKWPRPLHWMHIFLLTTVTTFPFLVTIVFWVLLATPTTFDSPFSTFANVTRHALNSAFALFEVLLTNIGPMPWFQLPITVLILLGYLGVAYATHATQGFYTYSFLDPNKQGKKLAAYIIGIAVGQIIIFLIVRGIIVLRERLVRNRIARTVKPETQDLAI